MTKRLIFIVVIAVFFTSLFYLYFILGGFKDVHISKVNTQPYILAGQYFEGKHNDAQIRDLFNQAKKHMESGALPGVITMIYHLSPEKEERGLVQQWVGVLVNDTTYQLPANYVYHIIDANQAVRAVIEAHNIVMPSPHSINQQIEEFAQQNNLELAPLSVEKILADDLIEVDRPVNSINH
jgi:hypothetical protein